jgi:hypothetical protein
MLVGVWNCYCCDTSFAVIYVLSMVVSLPSQIKMMQLWLHVQDNFGRLHDRSKETPKAMKQLTRLFPNKVIIQLPQVLSPLSFILQSFCCYFLWPLISLLPDRMKHYFLTGSSSWSVMSKL